MIGGFSTRVRLLADTIIAKSMYGHISEVRSDLRSTIRTIHRSLSFFEDSDSEIADPPEVSRASDLEVGADSGTSPRAEC